MSAIDAFFTVWARARRTFGAGTPAAGTQFDAGTKLRQMGVEVESAAPQAVWSGGAAKAYDATNTAHRGRFDRLAELDHRLGRSVDRSAELVSAGRQRLDALRQWVSDAAASVPPGKFQEAQLTQIASAGLGRLQEIVLGTHTDLGVVAQDIVKLTTEYESVSSDEKPAGDADEGGEKPDEPTDKTDKTDKVGPTRTTKPTPTMSGHKAALTDEISCWKRITRKVPTTGPTSVPRPPTTTHMITSVDSSRPTRSGTTMPDVAA